MYKSRNSNLNASGTSKHTDKSGVRYSLGTNLIDEDEFKHDHNQIYNDDSKFARQLKKLMREEEEDRKYQKIADLSSYLDQQENLKFVLKLGKPSLNILLKLLWEQQLNENKDCLVECISKIGSIMVNDRDFHKYFDWMIDKLLIPSGESKEKINRDNLIKILLLDALQKNFKNENFIWYLKDNINYILDELKKLLETVDTPNLMIQIAKTILQLSKPYSEAISRIFEDMVDILIAWHIDSSQSDEIISFTSNALVDLRSFWLKKLNFTITLLEQFLEDMESYLNSYLEDTKKLKEIENIEKVAALFNVYNTVVKSISCIEDSNYKPPKYLLNSNETSRILSTFNRLLVCLNKVLDSRYVELLFGPGNYSIVLFYDIFDENIFVFDDLLINYIINQNQVTFVWSNEVDLSYLRLLSKVLSHYISLNNTDLFKQLISFDGRLWNYKFVQNPKIVQESLNIYKQLIVVKSIPIVQEVYTNLLTDSELSFATILKCANSNGADTGLDECGRGLKGVKVLNFIKNAETSLLFNLCIFAELGNAAKNNLISMYAISPPLFELFTLKLSPCNWSLAEFFPNIQFAILSKFFAYCSRHEYFIANSSLFVSKFGNDSSSLFMNAVTRDYFKIMIETLTKLLAHPTTSDDSCLYVLNWIHKTIDMMSIDYGYLFETNLFLNLYNSIVTVAYSNDEISLICNKILLKTLNKFEKLTEHILIRVFDLCKYYVMSLNKNIRDSYLKLLCSIPVNISMSQIIEFKSLNAQDFSNFSSIARNNYVLSSSDCILSMQNFKCIMGYVLAGIQNQSEIYEKTWLERIFYSCKRNSPVEKTISKETATSPSSLDVVTIDSLVETHQGLLWFWALLESAQFCVQSKLKTPLGKAQDTFIAIETGLKNYFNYETLSQSQIQTTNNPWIDLNRLTLLLHFVEYLEKLIYTAYEGLAVGQQLTSKPVKIFFRTNKSTCNEWFWRVRYFIVNICCKSGHYELAVRQSYEYIQHCINHNLTTTNEFEQVIVMLVKSLIKLKSWQSLIGLHKWLNQTIKKSSSNTSYQWILSAAEEAKGRIEKACIGYKENLTNASANVTSDKSLAVYRFQYEKIFDCYFQLRDWNEYLSWYSEYKKTPIFEKLGESDLLKLENRIDINYIKSMGYFEENDFEMSKSYLKQMNFTNRDSLEGLMSTIDCKWSIDQIEEMFLKKLYTSLAEKRFVNSSNNEIFFQQLSSEILKIVNIDEMSYWHHQKLFLAQLGFSLSETNQNNLFSFLKSSKLDCNKHNIKYINYIQMLKSSEIDQDDFNLSCARFARKQVNLSMASRLLTFQLNNLNLTTDSDLTLKNIKLIDAFKAFTTQINETSAILTPKIKMAIVDCEKETCKLLHLLENERDGLESFELLAECAFRFSDDLQVTLVALKITLGIDNNKNKINFLKKKTQTQNSLFNEQLNEKHARSLLTLAKWINSKENSCIQNETISKLLASKKQMIGQEKFNLNSIQSSQIGDLYDLATVVAPKMAKSWYALADWCFKWGQKKADIDDLADLIPIHASAEEREFIKNLFSNNFNPSGIQSSSNVDNKSQLDQLCAQTFGMSLNRNGEAGFKQEMRTFLMEKCPSLQHENIEAILDVHGSWTKRSFQFHRVACNSYFTFLQLSDKNITDKSFAEANISATLRILKLLAKYSNELKDSLITNFSQTPTHPWKSIIPQLFCRLNHRDSHVRQSITELLFRVAKDYPHLIIYPAVVGCQDGPTRIETVGSNNNNNNKMYEKSSQTKEVEGKIVEDEESDGSDDERVEENKSIEEEVRVEEVEEENEIEDDEENEDKNLDSEAIQSELKTSYKSLLDTLTLTYPKTIDQVKLFVHEMRRITLLREELWLGTLNQIHPDITKRVEQLAAEVVRINQNGSLSDAEKESITKEKYEIILQPIVTILEHVQEITLSLEDETPNESQFRQDFEKKIETALQQLKDSGNAARPAHGWQAFKHLHSVLHTRSQRRQSSSLNMESISPKLALLKATSIPLPGKDGGHQCTIYSISNSLLVLPTKTKPKKLMFMGSNGRRYPYLFKGLEDLHLDERIMQLLSIVNGMFCKINSHESVHYHALNYSVTPLGPRSGLISWVEGATPLFTLYKRWQQREAIYLQTKQQQQQQQQAHPPPLAQQQLQIARPNDLYYAKLNPLLKEKGVKNFHETRNQCPPGILRQVLEELIKETPGDLLAKELWCNSSTPANWLKTLQIYSRSTAVMSMVGYVIGLGDRHLDNVLVNMSTGEVAHIDYNICFEKGQNLRVPERVPFRLTQNLEQALGVTKVEGMFRCSCESAMGILRREKEILLTLLEAFVDDPLLDWQAGSDVGIIASFYGGGGAKVELNQSNQQISVAHKNSKENRKNMEKKLAYRLYSIRLAETKYQALQNKENIIQTLSHLLLITSQICELTEKADQKELIIRLHEQSKIYLDESLTLHGEISSKTKSQPNPNPVYTLHERHSRYLEFNEALKKVKDALTKQIEAFETLSLSHLKSIRFIKGSSNGISIMEKVRNFLNLDPNETQIESVVSVVNDFMNSIGQSSVLVQYENIFTELGELKLGREGLLESFETIYSKLELIYKWLPGNVHLKSQHIKLLQWLKELNASDQNGINSNLFASVYTGYIQLYNRSFKISSMGKVAKTGLANSNFSIESKILVFRSEIETLEKQINDLNLRISNLVQNAANKHLDELKFKYDIFETQIMSFIEEKTNGDAFLENNSYPLFESFNYAQLQFLNDNLQKWITMETVACSAKEQLVHLTSREGDWYLDEMLSLIYNCANFSRLLKLVYTKFNDHWLSELGNSLEAIDTLALLFRSLKELLHNFPVQEMMILCFEDVKTFENILGELRGIDINGFFEAISRDTFQQLEFLINPECKEKVENMKFKYSQLILNQLSASPQSNLLIEIEKIFYKIENEFKKCLQFCKTQLGLQDPTNLLPASFALTNSNLIYLLDDNVYSLYSSIFLVKKIQTLQLYFEQCIQYRSYFECNANLGSTFEFSMESFLNPLKTYISDFIVQMLTGVPTTLIGNLLVILKNDRQFQASENEMMTIENQNEHFSFLLTQKLATNQINEMYFTAFNQLMIGYDSIWSEMDILGRLESSLEFKTRIVNCLKAQANSFEWLHVPAIIKPILDESDALIASLSLLNSKGSDLIEKLAQFEANISKRIEWASSTNPSLKEVLRQLELRSKKNQAILSIDRQLFGELQSLANGWLNFEHLRVKPLDCEKQFEALLKQIESAQVLNDENNSDRQLSDVELNLIEFHEFKDKKQLNTAIIQEYYNLLFDELAQLKRIKQKEEKECVNKMDELGKISIELKSLLNLHNRVMSDIKPLLKQISRYGESSRLQEYSKSYHQFSEMCQTLLRCLTNQIAVKANPNDVKERLRMVIEVIPKIYEDLYLLGNEETSSRGGECVVEKKQSALKPTRLSSRNGEGFLMAQDCNSYAMSVWKRVYQKLDGRDPDLNRVMGIEEQVEYLINQATDLNKLALLYEGWTAWV